MEQASSRPAYHADDRWYPASATALRRAVQSYIEQAAAQELGGEVVGLVCPHAGYFFSGHVAGAAYRQVSGGTYDTVVLIGPDHTGVALGELALPDYAAWHTPLGDVAVDGELAAALEQRVRLRRLRREREHSLEVQLPFLQVALADFKLLPLMMGDQTPATCRQVGQCVAELVRDRKVLLVASTDLSHFQPDHLARQTDAHTLSYALDFDPQGLAEALERGEAQACGGGPVAAVMFAARQLGAARVHQVKYATSADVWDDRSRVVGYAALALTKPRDGQIR